MKALAIVALVLGLGAIGASVYAKVETHPNYTSLSAELKEHGPSTKFDVPLLEDYKKTLDQLHYAAWGAGGLALVLGGVALAKKKGALPAIAMASGAIGAGLSFISNT